MSKERKQVATQVNKFPSLNELVTGLDVYKKTDELNFLLNQEPPKKWIKGHPIIKKDAIHEVTGAKIKVPYEYLPIDKVEYLLRKIFKNYKIEVLREGVMFNAVYTAVRVHYLHPILNEWAFHDGVGAWNIQLNKGANPSDLNAIKSSAVVMALPLSKTLAIKDAADMFGKLFGSDLNRADVKAASLDKTLLSSDDKLKSIKNMLDIDGLNISEDDRMNIERIIDQKETISYDKAIKLLNSKTPK